jgi:hypothetical protein
MTDVATRTIIAVMIGHEECDIPPPPEKGNPNSPL